MSAKDSKTKDSMKDTKKTKHASSTKHSAETPQTG